MLRNLIYKIRKYFYLKRKNYYEGKISLLIQDNPKYKKLQNKQIKISDINSNIKLYYEENEYILVIIGEMKITKNGCYFIIYERYTNE